MRRRAKKKVGANQKHRFVIPRRFKFPFGYRIWIKRVPPTELAKVHTCKQCGHYEGGACDGTWDVDTKTIWLDKTIPRRRQRAIFIHEFDHAKRDWEQWLRDLKKAVD